MITKNRRDFFNTAAFIGASAASLLIASIQVEEKSKLTQDRISEFFDTSKSNDCGFCKYVCPFQIHAICGLESNEYSIVLILIL